jgi:hypothetical protein
VIVRSFSEEFSIPFRVVKAVFALIDKSADVTVYREVLVKTLEQHHFPPSQLEFFVSELARVLNQSPRELALYKRIRTNIVPWLEVYDLEDWMGPKLRLLRSLPTAE